MKKTFFALPVVLLAMMALSTLTGCQKFEDLFPCHNFHPGQPAAVTMNFISYTAHQGTGTFTSHGGLVTSGTYTMVVQRINPNSIHCTTTCVTQEGTFTILSDCQLDTMLGHWTIANGTGDYASLRGDGTLVMMETKDGKKEETAKGNVY